MVRVQTPSTGSSNKFQNGNVYFVVYTQSGLAVRKYIRQSMKRNSSAVHNELGHASFSNVVEVNGNMKFGDIRSELKALLRETATQITVREFSVELVFLEVGSGFHISFCDDFFLENSNGENGIFHVEKRLRDDSDFSNIILSIPGSKCTYANIDEEKFKIEFENGISLELQLSSNSFEVLEFRKIGNFGELEALFVV